MDFVVGMATMLRGGIPGVVGVICARKPDLRVKMMKYASALYTVL